MKVKYFDLINKYLMIWFAYLLYYSLESKVMSCSECELLRRELEEGKAQVTRYETKIRGLSKD